MAKEKKAPTFEQWKSKAPAKVFEGLNNEQIRAQYDALLEEFKAKQEDAEDVIVEEAEPVAGLSYPPNPRKDPTTKILRGKWRDQKRVKCAHAKCCYPLNPVVIKGERQKMTVPDGHENEGAAAYKAECSWDPRHLHPEDGSTQYITHAQLFPPEDPGDEDF